MVSKEAAFGRDEQAAPAWGGCSNIGLVLYATALRNTFFFGKYRLGFFFRWFVLDSLGLASDVGVASSVEGSASCIGSSWGAFSASGATSVSTSVVSGWLLPMGSASGIGSSSGAFSASGSVASGSVSLASRPCVPRYVGVASRKSRYTRLRCWRVLPCASWRRKQEVGNGVVTIRTLEIAN